MELVPEEALEKMKSLLAEKRLSVFAGSGISVESGLPTWDGFIDEYIDLCEKLNASLDESDEKKELKFDDILEDARKNKAKDLISTISALREKVKECKSHGVNTDYICQEQLKKRFYKATPNEYHKAIVSTDYKYIITTNYDLLLEDAADELGYKYLTTHTYSYSDSQDLSRMLYSEKSAIIHAHGKISNIQLENIIVTKDDYLTIMKHNPGFRLIMNNIFVTTSVLFVGYGGSDPHFEDIISDLNMTLNWNNKAPDLPRCYIMSRRDKVTPIRRFLNDQHRVDLIIFDDYDGMKKFMYNLSTVFPREK